MVLLLVPYLEMLLDFLADMMAVSLDGYKYAYYIRA
jgi:hypothetical protein